MFCKIHPSSCILQLLHPAHVYSFLHVYWFYNIWSPLSFIPSSSAIRKMRVCSCFKAIIVIKKGQNFCNAHFGTKKTFLQKLDGTNPTHPRKFRRPCNMIGMIYGPTFNSDNKIPRGWKIQTDIILFQVQ